MAQNMKNACKENMQKFAKWEAKNDCCFEKKHDVKNCDQQRFATAQRKEVLKAGLMR